MIYTSDDLPLGEIGQIMRHVERGRISYVLVSVGGFLGGAAGWVPIPPQLGAFVWATDLEALYEAYRVEPYWTN